MGKQAKEIILIIAVTLLSTLAVWMPFFLRLPSFWGIPLPKDGMATIMKNYDGLYYLAIAKNLFQPLAVNQFFPFNLSPAYYAAHFPLYPIFINIFAPLFGFLRAIIAVPLLASIGAAVVFYLFLKEQQYTRSPLWLTIVFLFFPARWLVVRSIGSPEPLFILFLLLSFYFFKKQNYWLAGIFGAAFQATKSPGILLFAAYLLYLFWSFWKDRRHPEGKIILPLTLIPLSLIAVFTYYGFVYRDFFAYFHSGDNIHIFWPPFTVFNQAAYWVGTFWLEDIVFLYLIGALGVIYLFRRKLFDIGFFAAIFYLSILFVSHRDISRYSLPAWPFFLIAFEPLLIRKEFKIAFGLTLLPIFLYSINFIVGNTLPVADWTYFVK